MALKTGAFFPIYSRFARFLRELGGLGPGPQGIDNEK